ncbi:MAG: serine/threonine-protein kinase, partial [Anaerolineae bacterium]
MPLRPGDVVGSYEIVSLLGQGGMATVYRAYHARLNRQVAIKMIHPTYLDDQSWIARFEREAQIIAALEHPNIVPVYDFSEHAGEPYLVMKLIEGSTLKAMLANGALRVEDILSIAAPVAQALDYAHGQGVLHRDIKPSNLMLDRQMTPYLTDFGLARIAVAGDSTISKDMLMGTPYYIAPEQALKNGKVDYRADLYSFGVVLYELLVGKVPFSSGTPYS